MNKLLPQTPHLLPHACQMFLLLSQVEFKSNVSNLWLEVKRQETHPHHFSFLEPCYSQMINLG
jgi:hypothetical protein